METKTERWTLRATPAQDAIVRTVLEAKDVSLNEYVVNCAVEAAANDLADRLVFTMDAEAWDELLETLDRPPTDLPAIRKLFSEPSVLE